MTPQSHGTPSAYLPFLLYSLGEKVKRGRASIHFSFLHSHTRDPRVYIHTYYTYMQIQTYKYRDIHMCTLNTSRRDAICREGRQGTPMHVEGELDEHEPVEREG